MEHKMLQGKFVASQNMMNKAEVMISEELKKKNFSEIESGQVLLAESKKMLEIINNINERAKTESLHMKQLKCKKLKTV